MRLDGDRWPKQPKQGTTGGAECRSGADNEVWSYSEEVYEICRTYLELRERMRPYITEVMKEAHLKGTPVMRPMFYDFPDDENCWSNESQYMFGNDVLVAPVLHENHRSVKVYLPAGTKWTDAWTGERSDGGQTIAADAPLERIPVFIKAGSMLAGF